VVVIFFPTDYQKNVIVNTISKYCVLVLHLSLKSFSFNKQSTPFAHNTPVKYNLGFFFSTSIAYYKDDILGCVALIAIMGR